MLDGAAASQKQKADGIVGSLREALGAEKFVDTTNVAAVPGSSTLFLQKYFERTRRETAGF